VTLTIEINPELEDQLRNEAKKAGLEPKDYVLSTLKDRLRHPEPEMPYLTERESDLLLQINEGLPQELWHRYNELRKKPREESLTADEHALLIEISDSIESANARRVEKLVELARVRKVSLEALIHELGIKAPSYV